MKFFVSCNYDWEDSDEFVSEAAARAWMIAHNKEFGHDEFRVWEFIGDTTVKTKKTTTEERVELVTPKRKTATK